MCRVNGSCVNGNKSIPENSPNALPSRVLEDNQTAQRSLHQRIVANNVTETNQQKNSMVTSNALCQFITDKSYDDIQQWISTFQKLTPEDKMVQMNQLFGSVCFIPELIDLAVEHVEIGQSLLELVKNNGTVEQGMTFLFHPNVRAIFAKIFQRIFKSAEGQKNAKVVLQSYEIPLLKQLLKMIEGLHEEKQPQRIFAQVVFAVIFENETYSFNENRYKELSEEYKTILQLMAMSDITAQPRKQEAFYFLFSEMEEASISENEMQSLIDILATKGVTGKNLLAVAVANHNRDLATTFCKVIEYYGLNASLKFFSENEIAQLKPLRYIEVYPEELPAAVIEKNIQKALEIFNEIDESEADCLFDKRLHFKLFFLFLFNLEFLMCWRFFTLWIKR